MWPKEVDTLSGLWLFLWGIYSSLSHLRDEVGETRHYFLNFCDHHDLAAEAQLVYSTDVM